MYLTEQELIESQQQNLFLLDNQIKKQKFKIEDIADFIPGFFHLNRIEDVSIVYVNKNGENYFGMSFQQMIDSGVKHMVDNYHSSTFTDVIPKVVEFGKSNNTNKVFGYTQFLRRDSKQQFEAYLGFSKISKELNGLVCVENPVSVFGSMAKKMNRLFDDNEFLRKNYKKFALLTKREIEIIKLIGIGISRNDIAEMLFISKHTLDNHRKNIRKKLEVKNSAELFRYIHAFDLI